MSFGIQYSSLSEEIQIGSIGKSGREFTRHEYCTQAAIWAVAEYIEKSMGGSMFISLNGKRYDIDVTSEDLT